MRKPIEDFVQAWNCHRIPGTRGGVPNNLARNSSVTHLPHNIDLSTSYMLQQHESHGSHLRRVSSFGTDPLRNHPRLQELRERDFALSWPDMNVVFQDVLHNHAEMFKNCISHFLILTNRFAVLLS